TRNACSSLDQVDLRVRDGCIFSNAAFARGFWIVRLCGGLSPKLSTAAHPPSPLRVPFSLIGARELNLMFTFLSPKRGEGSGVRGKLESLPIRVAIAWLKPRTS